MYVTYSEYHLCPNPLGIVCPWVRAHSYLNSLSFHAPHQAFLVATILAPVALSFVDDTIFILATGVGQIFAHCPFEEALATLATENHKKKGGNSILSIFDQYGINLHIVIKQ